MDKEAPSFHHHQKLQPPHRLIQMYWDSDQFREACEKSTVALDSLMPLSTPLEPSSDHHHHNNHHHHRLCHLIEVADVESLFLIDRKNEYHGRIGYSSYCDGRMQEERFWGSRDIMLNLGGATAEQNGVPQGCRQFPWGSSPSPV